MSEEKKDRCPNCGACQHCGAPRQSWQTYPRWVGPWWGIVPAHPVDWSFTWSGTPMPFQMSGGGGGVLQWSNVNPNDGGT